MDQAVALRYVSALRRAGFSAAICHGPSEAVGRSERCVLTTGEPCQLVEGADVVISGLGVGTEGRAVLEALRRYHPAKPLVVVVAIDELHLYGDLLDGVHILVHPVEPAELLAAVGDAIAVRPGPGSGPLTSPAPHLPSTS